MLIVVTGGAGSGKSALAERYAIGLAQEAKCTPVYIATMRRDPDDPETEAIIRRHREMRAGKGFITYELPCGIRQATESDGRFGLYGKEAGEACFSEEGTINCAGCAEEGMINRAECTEEGTINHAGYADGGTPSRRVYLLEDLPNLLANELWSEGGAMAETAGSIRDPVADTVGTAALSAELERELTMPLLKISEEADLVIVTGDVHSEGGAADAWTDLYMQLLGKAGRALAASADRVVEAVSGVPVVLKT